MFLAAALLGWLTVEGAITRWLLLLLTFGLGIGAALNGPASALSSTPRSIGETIGTPRERAFASSIFPITEPFAEFVKVPAANVFPRPAHLSRPRC
jgi:hypothetical protein